MTSLVVGDTYAQTAGQTTDLLIRVTISTVDTPSRVETNSIGRQTARVQQVLREKAAKFENGPLQKIARKIAKGQPAVVLSMGTSIDNAGASTYSKFSQALTREFGPVRGVSDCLGSIGGSTTGSYNGWNREPYPGLKFLRLRGTTSSSAWSEVLMGDVFRLWYDKAPGGGSFVLEIDGTNHTVDCNGTKAFAVLLEIPLAAGPHTVTYNPPSSGEVYIGWRECYYSTVPGIVVRNSTLGGSSLRNVYLPSGTPSIEGGAGLNAWKMPDVDLFYFGGPVNDAGSAEGSGQGGPWVTDGLYRAALDELIDYYVGTGTPVITAVNLSGHYRDAAASATNFTRYQRAVRDMDAQQRKSKVWNINWDQMLRGMVYDDLTHFFATFYIAPDLIHPVSSAFRPADDAISSLTGVAVKHDSNLINEATRAMAHLPPELSTLTEVTSAGKTKLLLPKASARRCAVGGQWRVPLYLDPAAANLDASFVATSIDGSATSDEFGKFFRGNEVSPGSGSYSRSFSVQPGTYWVAALVSGLGQSFRMQTANGRFLYAGDAEDTFSGLQSLTWNGENDAAPTWKVAKIKVTSTGNFEIRYNKLYDWCRVSAVGTSVPLAVR